MTQNTCLITGANSGIGKEIAIALAKTNAQVIMVCRNPERGKQAFEEVKQQSDSTNVDLLLADLSSQKEIRKLAKTIHERYPTLNILINNAGVVLYKKMLSTDGIEMTLATNHLGPFLLTNLLLDLLEKNTPSRIINISSAVHKWAKTDLSDLQYEHRKYQFMGAYAQSKLFMNLVSFELARRLEGKGVTVNCVHPGAVKTHLGTDSTDSKVLKWLDKLIKSFFITPEKGAETPIYLATSKDVENITGKYYVKGKPVAASAISYDAQFAKKVWDLSEALVGKSE